MKRPIHLTIVALALPAFLLACQPEEEQGPVWPELGSGTLVAGAAGGHLDLPVGVPLGGYTGRDRTLGDVSGPDSRDSDYRTDFVPSAGWQTRIPADVLWLENGAEHAVLVRFDLIYSFDGLTEALGEALSEAVGQDLSDSVFTFANHSHSSYGPFTKSTLLFFGGDFFQQEVFDRLLEQLLAFALQAYEGRKEAAIGLGIDPTFDPIDGGDLFHDRREQNDHLHNPDGEVTGAGYKDPQASLLRVDGTDGEPIAALFSFGIHGTVLGGDNLLISSEAPGHIASLLQHRHGGPRWIFAQGAGGDVAPGGEFSEFARLESLAEKAADRLVELWEATETAAGAIALDPVQRYVEQGRQIQVTRNGSTQLEYLPWDPAWAEDPYRPDLQVWADGCDGLSSPDCEILSPLDEFWAQHGAALCGEPEIDISLFGLDVNLPQYASCLDVDKAFSLFKIAFREYMEDRDDYPLPLPESRTSLLGALGLSDLPVTELGQGTEEESVVLAFAPGEATTLWAQFLRHRARTEKDVSRSVVIGYAMDHEGYLLTVDDWLCAGYESAIVWWGPLQGEYLLEQLLDVMALAASPVVEDPAYPDFPTGTWYPDWKTPFVEPDATPEAGTLPSEPGADLFVWDGQIPSQVQPLPEVHRIQGLAEFVFLGSDPATGLIEVWVERQDEKGQWSALTTPAGTEISDALPDVLVTYTPDPLRGGSDDPDPVRTHRYAVAWQAVNTWSGLDQVASLPLGTYRFRVHGASRDPESKGYPYGTLPWELSSEPFAVVPAHLDVSAEITGVNLRLNASYSAALRGYRMLHSTSGPKTPTPLVAGVGGLELVARPTAGGEGTSLVIAGSEVSGDSTVLTADVGGLAPGNWTLELNDGNGNLGSAVVDVQ